jgi:hypothetical protein
MAHNIKEFFNEHKKTSPLSGNEVFNPLFNDTKVMRKKLKLIVLLGYNLHFSRFGLLLIFE